MKKVIYFLFVLFIFSSCFFGIFDKTPKGMVYIEGGVFTMGDIWSNGDTLKVSVSPYCISKMEVSFKDYIEFLNSSKADSMGKIGDTYLGTGTSNVIEYDGQEHVFVENATNANENCPVSGVTWIGACYYCNWKSKQDGRDTVYAISDYTAQADWSKNGYRLPTEAEWEFAARGGSKEYEYSGTNDPDSLTHYAWYYNNASSSVVGFDLDGTRSIGSARPNNLGLYDMSGNIWEMCWDGWGAFPNEPGVHPDYQGSGHDIFKVKKGGYYSSRSYDVTVHVRKYINAPAGYFDCGFRLSCSVK